MVCGLKEGTGISGQLFRTVIHYVLKRWDLEIAILSCLVVESLLGYMITVFTIGTHEKLLTTLLIACDKPFSCYQQFSFAVFQIAVVIAVLKWFSVTQNRELAKGSCTI